MKDFINKIYHNMFVVLVLLGIFVVLPNNDANVNNSFVRHVFNKNVKFLSNEQNDVIINSAKGTWNSLLDEVDYVYTNTNLELVADINNPVTNLEYHIASELVDDALLGSLVFTPYINPIDLDEGEYVVYFKFINSNLEEIYINTDILVIDKTNPEVKFVIEGVDYDTYKDPLDEIVIRKDNVVEIIDNDLSKIKTVEYYFSSDDIDKEVLKLEPNSIWKSSDKIKIEEDEFKILYLKVVDNANNTEYFRTDKFRVSSYDMDVFVGYDRLEKDLDLTLDSIITFDFKYDTNTIYTDEFKHVLRSSFVFKENTLLTLINNKTKEVSHLLIEDDSNDYGYENSCLDESCKYAEYSFDLFKYNNKVNTLYDDELFEEDNKTYEDYTVIVDFTKALNEESLNNYLTLTLVDEFDIDFRIVFEDDVIFYNLYKDKNAKLNFESDLGERVINYNTNSLTVINLESEVKNEKVDEKTIFDPKLDNFHQSVNIKLLDAAGNVVPKEKLSSIVLKLGYNIITPSIDGVYRFRFSSNLDKTIKQLSILTFQNNGGLAEGDYRLVVTNFLSKDGYFNNKVVTHNDIIIPVVVSYDELNVNYSFGLIEKNKKILVKEEVDSEEEEELEVTFEYEILQSGDLEFPNIQVSLFKKKELTAFNQEYEKINLLNYVNNALILSREDTYFVTSSALVYDEPEFEVNEFRLDFLVNELENTSYKLLFELFDGEKLVAQTYKYFIVREK